MDRALEMEDKENILLKAGLEIEGGGGVLC